MAEVRIEPDNKSPAGHWSRSVAPAWAEAVGVNVLDEPMAAGRSLPGGTGRSMWQSRYAAKLVVTDIAVVCASVAVAQHLNLIFDVTWPRGPEHHPLAVSAVLAVGWVLALSAFRTRSPRVIGTGIEEYRRVVAASLGVFGAAAIVTAIVTLPIKPDVAAGYLAVALPCGTCGLVASRAAWRHHVRRRRVQGEYQTAVLIVGDRAAAVDIVNELTREKADGYRIVGVAIPEYGRPLGECIEIDGANVPVIGDESYALRAVSCCGADIVTIAMTEHFGAQSIRRLIWDLEPSGVDLVVSQGAIDIPLERLAMRPSAALSLLYTDKPHYRQAKQFGKRAFDVCFAMAALAIIAPVMLAAAAAIKLTSKGPVLYAAERIGIDGKPFTMLKFRTMVDGADRQVAALMKTNEVARSPFTTKDDPRVTSVGRVLRRLGIDELPQFINVLRNEMSVVGPRPPLRREFKTYGHGMCRPVLVNPGMSGLWQVGGRRDPSWENAVRLDPLRFDTWSMAMDLVIVARTLRAVIRRIWEHA